MTVEREEPMRGDPMREDPIADRQIALIDLLDRLLSGGVVLTGDLMLSIADIDLVRISLRALIVSVTEEMEELWIPGEPTTGEK